MRVDYRAMMSDSICGHVCCIALRRCRSNNSHVSTQLGVGCHWWFNYPGPLLDVEFEFTCLSG